MNTLSKQYTSKFFASQEDYDAFRARWGKLVNSDKKNSLTATHHLIYLVLCGKNWQKAFSLPTNKNKLENGYTPEIRKAMGQFRSTYLENWVLAPFYDAETDSAVSHEAMVEARKLVIDPLIIDYKFLSDPYYPIVLGK
jgi:hypothetical protein